MRKTAVSLSKKCFFSTQFSKNEVATHRAIFFITRSTLCPNLREKSWNSPLPFKFLERLDFYSKVGRLGIFLKLSILL